jgi:hypothetical protein
MARAPPKHCAPQSKGVARSKPGYIHAAGCRNRCAWEMVLPHVRSSAHGLGSKNCSRFLFRHGSGTDVCWCKLYSFSVRVRRL